MKNKTISISLLSVSIVLMMTASTLAQNFADFVPANAGNTDPQNAEKPAAGAKIDPEIASVLEQNGVPINRNLADPEANSNYTLGNLDVILITVMRHPEVSGEFMINNEGKIQYGFVGDIALSGMTKQQVKELLTEKLAEYIISPEVTVTITGYNSKVVYVIGEVGAPGKIFMRGDTITVREALVQAGLPLLSAKLKKGSLITPAEDGNAVLKEVNVHKLLIKGDLRENLVMLPGDTLYLPPTMATKALRAIAPVAAPIGTAAGTGRTVTTGF